MFAVRFPIHGECASAMSTAWHQTRQPQQNCQAKKARGGWMGTQSLVYGRGRCFRNVPTFHTIEYAQTLYLFVGDKAMEYTGTKKISMNGRPRNVFWQFSEIVWQSFLIFDFYTFAGGSGFWLVVLSMLAQHWRPSEIRLFGASTQSILLAAYSESMGPEKVVPTWINENVCFMRFAVPTRQMRQQRFVQIPSTHFCRNIYQRMLTSTWCGNWFTRERTQQEPNLKMMMLIIYGCRRIFFFSCAPFVFETFGEQNEMPGLRVSDWVSERRTNM